MSDPTIIVEKVTPNTVVNDGKMGPQGPKGDTGPAGRDGTDGAAGPQGPEGPQGVAGPAGADGTSFDWRGLWNVATAYDLNDVVQGSDGSAYILKVAGDTGHDPVVDVNGGEYGTYWDLTVMHGATGPQGPQGPQGASGDPGTGTKISSLVDAAAPQSGDELVIARAGGNYKLSYDELEAALDGRYLKIPGVSGANEQPNKNVTGSTYEHFGYGFAFTPTTDKALIIITGVVNCTIQGPILTGRYGTGVAPVNGAGVAGTEFAYLPTIDVTSSAGAPFTVQGILTGLTPGTAYWVDLVGYAQGGTETVEYPNFSAVSV